MKQRPYWKQMISRSPSKDSNSKRSIKSSKKFNPKRLEDQSNQTMKFRNQTISRVQQSLIQSKLNQRSRVREGLYRQDQSLSLNQGHSASTPNLLMRSIPHETNSVKKDIEPCYNRVQYKSKNIRNSNSLNEDVFDELQRLKKQFQQFKLKIFSELKHQEKLLVQMFQQAIKNMKLAPQEKQKTLVQPQPQILTLNSKIMQLLNNNTKGEQVNKTPFFHQRKILQAQNRGKKGIPIGKQGRISKHFFDRFLGAVNSLKQEIKQIENLSQTSDQMKDINNERNDTKQKEQKTSKLRRYGSVNQFQRKKM